MPHEEGAALAHCLTRSVVRLFFGVVWCGVVWCGVVWCGVVCVVAASNHTMQLIAATLFVHEEKYAEALKAVKGLYNLEQLALAVQVCIKLNRLDVAQGHIKKMQAIDDESTLTQLATAWTYLAQGGDKFLEASYLFQEQIDKFGGSVVLLNGLASAKIGMGQFDDAEKLLIDAIGKVCVCLCLCLCVCACVAVGGV